MDGLPSYEEATTLPHWLQLAAPYVPMADWRRCCLVNSQFHEQFASRLWLDPLVTARAHGLHPNDDLSWYRKFINVHLKSVRPSTRALVRSLDFRDFAIVASGLYSSDASERAISESLKGLPTLFPNLICLLIAGHPEINSESLVATHTEEAKGQVQTALQMLDLAGCLHPLTTRMFRSSFLRDLVYLDISFLPGSVGTLVQTSLNPEFVPELRILKVRSREMDDATAHLLLERFGRQLWSLDISENKLTDATIESLIEHSFSELTYQSDQHFNVEGKLKNDRSWGTREFGPFESISESNESSSFTHRMRYVPDAPPYHCHAGQQDLQEWQVVRLTGVESRINDSAAGVLQCLLDDALQPVPEARGAASSIRQGRGGLTHLYLNGNRFTSAGIQKLLRCVKGQLQHFECDSSRLSCLVPDSRSLPQVHGLFGLSHLFRPVFASNLRSLRIHHSAVTCVPRLEADWLPPREAAIQAERVFRQHIQMAYPCAFVPDMNPRITSLTLTQIPARSSGPLIRAITRFLDLASDQQLAMRESNTNANRRDSANLTGLCHIRLELLHDHARDLTDVLSDEGVDFDQLLDPVAPGEGQGEAFWWDHPKHKLRAHSVSSKVSCEAPNASSVDNNPVNGDELSVIPQSSGIRHNKQEEYVHCRIDAADSWTGNMFTVPVWVGCGVVGPSPALNEYMSNVLDSSCRKNIGPAMPDQIAAGVPPGSYIFHDAWTMMVLPTSLRKLDDESKRDPMDCVATAIKEYRQKTKGTNRHWNGKLELLRVA
ncbi:hypothetical protein PFICI_14885 [Pestalotiopsis fici W106-1]|uniref:Uncharacterized protein n=1 Tax=Pestalotiopsis fici (strain W106-1 / CGMCC3.15140) TaxID=1229662 RepID=W3WH91_PESFW|nr:uncharacterized protein PFICI_14885 [Pestalotiopsis fici W106-1]ETS73280.1 hypothetical protein PFICI_14885 [Pestalotiopsis fici W106-1]